MSEIAKELARIALQINAIKLRPKDPFLWASGYRMPIYNDNRMLLGDYRHRRLIADGFCDVVKTKNLHPEVVAGTATAGIPPATTLADTLQTPFIYVRGDAKDHGLKNRIEGILKPGQRVLMVEDLISTGGSSIEAIQAIREAGGICNECCSIFSYGLAEAEEKFAKIECKLYPLLTYDTLLEEAVKTNYINSEELALLKAWRSDPFGWGEKHGFPPKKKGSC